MAGSAYAYSVDEQFRRVIDSALGAELAVNVERRRAGEVSVGIVPEGNAAGGFAWITAAEARALAASLLHCARESEDLAEAHRPRAEGT